MKRLVFLFAAVAIAAVALGGLARRGVYPVARETAAGVAEPETTVTLLWCHEALQPDRLRIPRGRRVTLAVETTAETSPGSLVIRGYEGELEPLRVEPGERHVARFRTRLPGDGFEIFVGNARAGRLDVTGDHLEGERL